MSHFPFPLPVWSNAAQVCAVFNHTDTVTLQELPLNRLSHKEKENIKKKERNEQNYNYLMGSVSSQTISQKIINIDPEMITHTDASNRQVSDYTDIMTSLWMALCPISTREKHAQILQ